MQGQYKAIDVKCFFEEDGELDHILHLEERKGDYFAEEEPSNIYFKPKDNITKKKGRPKGERNLKPEEKRNDNGS